jgi:hypothetical protein
METCPTANSDSHMGRQAACLLEAGDGARTRDPQLGKLMLYQLSYTRAVSEA